MVWSYGVESDFGVAFFPFYFSYICIQYILSRSMTKNNSESLCIAVLLWLLKS